MNSKLPTDKSIEELLSSLESESVPDQVSGESFDDEVLRFITTFGITDGTQRVSPRLIRRLFRVWCGHAVDTNAFIRSFGLYFPQKYNHFYLNRDALGIGEQLYRSIVNTPKARKLDMQRHSLVKQFLAEKNVKPGKFYLSQAAFYYWFEEWVFANKKPRVFKVYTIGKFLKHHLPTKEVQMEVFWYGIDLQQALDLTPEKLNLITSWSKDFYGQRQEKQKKRKKVPSAGSRSKPKKQTRVDRLRLSSKIK